MASVGHFLHSDRHKHTKEAIHIIDEDVSSDDSTTGPQHSELYYVQLVRELRERLVDEVKHASDGCRSIPMRFSVILPCLKEFNEAILSQGVQFDVILENQRGCKAFGIPFFSSDSLIPWIDPPMFQSGRGTRLQISENHISNYPIQDDGWKWSWESWYIMMIYDTDDEGWLYSHIGFGDSFRWKGSYRFGSFVRRRIWIRMRERCARSFEEVG